MSAVVARPASPSLDIHPSQLTGSNTPSEADLHGSEHASDETKLFLGNLPLVITEEEIENVFSAYGPIENIVLLQRPPPKGRSGSPGARAAFVHFQNPASATAAINGLHGKRIFKRAQNPLVVRVADPPRQRGSISSEGSVGSKNLVGTMPKLAAYPSATPFAPFYSNQEYTIDAHPHHSYGQGVFSPPQYQFPPQVGFAPPRPTATQQEQARREPSYATPTGSGAPHVDGEVKLFVGNLPSNISQQALASLFAPFGDLLEVFVFRRGLPVTGAKCAFVRFRTEEAANAAIATLNSAMYSGRSLVVRHATQRNATERPRSGSLSSAGAPPPLMSQSPLMPITSPTHPLSSPQVQQHLGHVNLHHVQPPPALHHPQLHHPTMPQIHHQGQFSGYSEPVHHLSPTMPPHLAGPHGPMSPHQHPHTPDRMMHPAVFSPTHQLPPGHQYPAPISPLSHERGPSYYQHSPYYINYEGQAPRVDYPTYENEEKGSDSVSEHDNDSA